MSKFKLHTSVNGHLVGETMTVSDSVDSIFEKYGDKVEPEAAPENKAITEFETKEKPIKVTIEGRELVGVLDQVKKRQYKKRQ